MQEEARIIEELNRLSQVEYPRALLSQDCETARVHLQTIERLKESRTAIQHYLRVFDEMKISGKFLTEKLRLGFFGFRTVLGILLAFWIIIIINTSGTKFRFGCHVRCALSLT